MAFDAFFLSSVLDEIRQSTSQARVEKIHQPSKDTLVLLLKCQQQRQKLVFVINPAAPRLHLTEANYENPAEPPMFCMLLRKHLSGARLCAIEQVPMERAAVFTFSCMDEMGENVHKKLLAELMGRTCNLYLLGPDGRIIDCLRRVGLDETSRPALPGMYYQVPAPIEKEDPRSVDFSSLLSANGADVLAERLMDTLGGLSPLVCREAALFACGAVDARVSDASADEAAQKLSQFFEKHLNDPAPYYYALADGTPKQFAFCPIEQYGTCARADSFGALLDMFYTLRDQKDIMRQKSQAMRKLISNLCQRLTRKMALQEQELKQSRERERLRQLGDILTANLHKIQKGASFVSAEDFYDENMPQIRIPLSPLLSPQQNAAKYYKDYARMKTAEKELAHQLALGQQELSYLQSVLEEMDRAATEAELEQIRAELRQGGYLRQENAKKRVKQGTFPPLHFVSTDGYDIYVGRNNLQNDTLTFRTARKDDLWLHAHGVHGAHVIIACAGVTPPDNTITQAAQLAAYYAESNAGQNIAVDMTSVKQIKKAPGSKPGMVIYHSYRTIIANPYPDIVIDPLNAEK